ncbi:MAG: hypothetical protein PF482_14630 [Desulfobacteraceae bacterium]|jgi:predicted nucleotidyltransferase|nr:hypothetical protein [Desulfobacteraceae bacterium]
MEIQYINIALPEGSSVYVFGSSLNGNNKADLDLLILYKPSICPPSGAYEYHYEILKKIKQRYSVELDITMLTYDEEKQLGFIQRENAIPFIEYKQNSEMRIPVESN